MLSDRVSAGPALASESRTGPIAWSSATSGFGLVDRIGGQGAEFSKLVERFNEIVSLGAEHGESIGNCGHRLVEYGFLSGELASQAVKAVGRRQDVVFLCI